MSTPLIDILLPTYKPREEHLRAALQSLGAQTEHRWRLTVCDEPAEVNTTGMLQPFMDDGRIRFLRNERRLGIGGNWNRCMEQATAPFVQFLFQDDIWEPHYLATALQVMEQHPGAGMASLGHHYLHEGRSDTQLYEAVERAREAVPAGLHNGRSFLLLWIEMGLHPNIIGEPSFVLLRRDVAVQAGRFREDMQQNLDAEYWTRMLALADWAHVPGNYGRFRVHADAASARNFRSGAGIFDRRRMLRSAATLLPTAEQPRARRIIRQHTVHMAATFLMRYGGRAVQARDREPLAFFLLRHPLLTVRSVWRYARRQHCR